MLKGLKTGFLLLTLFNTDGLQQSIQVQLLRDLQKYFSSRWIILQTCSKTSLESHPMLSYMLAMTKYPEVFISVYDWRDFNSTSTGRYYAKRPMVLLSCWTCVVDCFLQMNNLNQDNIISRFIWILPPDIALDMRHLYIPVNCQFIRLTKMWNNDEYILKEMYRTSAESLMYTKELGTWNEVRGLTTSADSFLQRRSNFFGQPLVAMDAYQMLGYAGFIAKFPTYFPDIFKQIMARLNATIIIKYEKIVDFDFNIKIAFITQDNLNFILAPAYKTRVAFFFKNTASKFALNSYLMPFDNEVWLVLLAWTMLTSLLLFGVARILGCRHKHIQLREYIFQSLVIILQKFETPKEKYLSFRIIGITHWFFSVMIFSCYSAIIISFITIVVSKPPFSTLEGVVRDNSYNVVSTYEGISHALETDPQLNEIYRKRFDPPDPKITTLIQAFRELCFGKRKLISISSAFFIILIREILPDCQLSEHKVHIITAPMSWPTKQYSPYKNEINFCITKLTECGVFMYNVETKMEPNKRPKPEPECDSITLDQTIFTFIALSAGILLSSLILLLEIYFAR